MKIFFVDEDAEQRETFAHVLRQCVASTDSGILVEEIEPRPTLAEMDFLVTDPDVVTVVLDERLKESGVATYFGIELAQYLRAINKKIPIYILTSYVDSEEIADGEFSVEDVLDKQNIVARTQIEGARMCRRIDTYLDIQSEREKRFELLLRESTSRELSERELKEFRELGYLRAEQAGATEIVGGEDVHSSKALEARIAAAEQRVGAGE